jgi:hypothetical protein
LSVTIPRSEVVPLCDQSNTLKARQNPTSKTTTLEAERMAKPPSRHDGRHSWILFSQEI